MRYIAIVYGDDAYCVFDNYKKVNKEFPFNYMSEAQERADELNELDKLAKNKGE